MEIVAALLLFGLTTALKKDPSLPQHGAPFTISRIPLSGGVQPLSDLKVTDHVVSLKRGNSKSLSSIYVQTMRKHSDAAMGTGSRLGVRFFRQKNPNSR